MMKDTFFNPSRFRRVLVKELKENRRTLLLRAVVLYGILAVTMLWQGYLTYSRFAGIDGGWHREEDPIWNTIFFMFAFGLYGFGAICASLAFADMRDKSGRLALLMVPATGFEKFFARWLVYCLLFVPVFFLLFELADLTRVGVCSWLYPGSNVLIAPVNVFGEHFLYSGISRGSFVALFFFVQSFFLLGGAVWPRNAFLKTFAVGTALSVAYAIAFTLLMKMLADMGLDGFWFEARRGDAMFWMLVSGCSLFGIVNLLIAYYRFKEWEIVSRM